MKNVFKILFIAALVMIATISVTAAKITYDLVPYDEESGWYEVTFTVNMEFEEGIDPISVVNTVEQYVSFNPEKLILADTEYNSITDYSQAGILPIYPYTVYKSGRTEYAYTIAEPFDNDGNSLSWVEQSDGTVQGWITAAWSLAYELDTNDLLIGSIAFKLADGVTVEDLASNDFVVDMVYLKDTNYGSYGYKCDGYTTVDNPLTVVNNVVPEAVAITIPVLAGDIVYLQDGTYSTMAADNDAYEVPATVGYVAVNTGYTNQVTYYIDGTSAVATHTDAVLGSDVYSLRDHTNVITSEGVDLGDRNGLRFKMLSSQSSRDVEAPHDIVEMGFLMTAKVPKVVAALGENPVLTYDKVGEFVKSGVAYDPAKNIDIRMDSDDDVIDIRGVFYNIPITETGVNTVIVSRPYYKVGDAYVYGETSETTLYAVAKNLKENDWENCSESLQQYIDEIIFQAEGTDFVEEEVIIDISGLYD